MTLGIAFGLWLLTIVASIGTLCIAILAGRSHHLWQTLPLLLLELITLGAAIVLWMFAVWFVAKTFMGIGLSATGALILGIVIGLCLAALTAIASPRLVRLGYDVFGWKATFDLDFGNSLWLGRSGTWRPNELTNP